MGVLDFQTIDLLCVSLPFRSPDQRAVVFEKALALLLIITKLRGRLEVETVCALPGVLLGLVGNS